MNKFPQKGLNLKQKQVYKNNSEMDVHSKEKQLVFCKMLMKVLDTC